MLKGSLKLLKNSPIAPLVKKTLPPKLYNGIRDILIHDSNIRLYFDNHVFKINPKTMQTEGLMLVSYWDGRPNFGDLIGPYLISKITNRPIINILNSKKTGLLTVGSILQSLNREGMTVWGSGFIDFPSDDVIDKINKYKPKILSLRGEVTAQQLSKSEIDIPISDCYGDPALILPLFYKPDFTKKKSIALVPHYQHQPFFIKQYIDPNTVKIVDVQKDVESVVKEISSSFACISTSLHGLIIAQAYQIPWLWLEVVDDELTGSDFKFKDFFSMLDSSNISHVKITLDELKNIDFVELAKKAHLPDKKYSETKILEALTTHLNLINYE